MMDPMNTLLYVLGIVLLVVLIVWLVSAVL